MGSLLLGGPVGNATLPRRFRILTGCAGHRTIATRRHPSAGRTIAMPVSTVSRRTFLRLAALASAAPTLDLGSGVALAQESPRKGGTLRVGFYIEAATMDPHYSGSKIDRQVYHNI